MRTAYRALMNGEFIYWEVGNKSNWFWDMVHDYDLIPDQFIGLQDCHGNKIYEKDILKYHGPVHWKIQLGTTSYGQGGTGEVVFIGYYFDGYYKPLSEDEIIGNVYENPELLKERYYE